MNWVIFWTLLGLAIGNLAGVIWHHIEDKKDREEKLKLGKTVTPWKKDKAFWEWTICLMLFGICFVILRLLLIVGGFIKNGFKK